MGSVADFVISDGVLASYKGKEAIVEIPDGVVEIGDRAFEDNKSVKEVMMPDSVVSIGYSAFHGCKKLASITLSNNIEIIGGNAFSYCEKLVSISLPSTLKKIGGAAFKECPLLSSINVEANLDDVEVASDILVGCLAMADKDGFVIFDTQLMAYYGKDKDVVVPDGVTYIASNVFKENATAQSITLPDSVEEIGNNVFEGCKKLESIVIPEGVSIGSGAFHNCKKLIDENNFVIISGTAYGYFGKEENLVIPSGVKVISGNLLVGSWWGDNKGEKIKTISFPDTLEIIEAGAFKQCGKLEEVTIPSSVKKIGNSAFSNCQNIKKVSVPETVELGYSAFSSCTGLKDEDGFVIVNNRLFNYYGSAEEVVVPDGVESIGPEAFEKAILKRIKLPKSLKVICRDAFYQCENLEEIEIPDGIKEINHAVFCGCTNLKKVAIPSTVNKIEDAAFQSCKSIEEIAIPDGVVKIESGTFLGCSSLVNIIIPKTVVKIGSSAFKECVAIEQISIPASVEVIEKSAFEGCTSLKMVESDKLPENTDSTAFEGCDALADENGMVIVAGVLFKYIGEGGNVVIPDGVTEICPNVFREGDNGYYRRGFTRYREEGLIKGIEIPSSVHTIHRYAFAGITKLKRICIPSSVTNIGVAVLSSCESLEEVEFNATVNSIPDKLLQYCRKLKSITLNGEIKEIGVGAFTCCEALKAIVLPPMLEKINAGAFSGCKSLSNISIPNTVDEIQIDAFSECNALKTIEVGDDNSSYKVNENVLFDKDGSEIIFCPAGLKLDSYSISEDVSVIHSHAFKDCKKLKTIVIPASVKIIGDKAFPQYSWREQVELTDIQVDSKAKLEYVGEEIFEFPSGEGPLVYPCLPPTYVKEQTIQVRLGLGFCSSPSKYTGEYLELYKKYADSHQKTLLKKATSLKLTDVLKYFSETDDTNSVSGKLEKVNYKKLSESAKVELLERAIIEGDVASVKEVIEGCQKFEFTARALGIACLYGGLEKVKLLVANGAKFTFKYDSSLKRKYGCAYSSTYSLYPCEYDLMLANEGDEFFISTLYASSGEYHFGKLPEINAKPISADERAEIAEYLYDNAKKAGFHPNNVLFYAILWGCNSVAEKLIEKGCELPGDGKKAISDTANSVSRNEVLCTLPALSEEKCAYAISKFSELLEKEDLKMILVQKVFDEADSSFISDEVIKILVEKTDTSKITKSKVLELIVKAGKIGALEILAGAEWFKTPAQRDKLIKYATDNKCKESLAWLMDYKNRTADVKKEAEKAEAKMMKELMEDPNSASAIKKSWVTKKADDGTLIVTNYKGEGTEIVVPAVIGKTAVTVIGPEAVKAYSGSWCPAKIKNNDARNAITSVIISDGIKEIGEEAFSGLSQLVKVEIPDSVKVIGKDAFRNCTKLTFEGLRIPENIKEIGAGAFLGCAGLKDKDGCIIMNGILVSVDRTAEEIVVPEGVRVIATGAFGGGGWSSNEQLKKVTLPSTVVDIREGAFAKCTALESVNIPDGIKIIREETFYRCKKLKELVFPESVTTFRKDAFNDCDALKIMRIPASVTTIHANAFGYWPWNKTIYTPAGSKAEEYFKQFTDHYITVITE